MTDLHEISKRYTFGMHRTHFRSFVCLFVCFQCILFLYSLQTLHCFDLDSLRSS